MSVAVQPVKAGPHASHVRPSGGLVPPADVDAEAVVLSDIVLRPDNYDLVCDILAPQDFYSDANRRIYEAIVSLREDGRAVDIELVAGWLRDKGHLQSVNVTYLAKVIDATPSVANVVDHAKRVKDKARVRLFIATGKALVGDAYGDYGDADDLLQRAERAIGEIAHETHEQKLEQVGAVMLTHVEALQEARDRGESVTGISTGFTDLDKRTNGLFDGDLYIVAGRPGMGKSALATSLAMNVARPKLKLGDEEYTPPKYGAAIFSLEMPKQQLATRCACAEKTINIGHVRSGSMSNDDFDRLKAAAHDLERFPLWVDDSAGIGLMEIRARLRKLQRDIEAGRGEVECDRLGLVVIDYLQLMSGRRQHGDNREQEVSGISRGLKQLAKDLQVPVMALSQLNRAVETRPKKRPQLADLRESGAIEQDADAIWFLYRPGYYDDQEDDSETDIDIAKQRMGPTGRSHLYFDGKHARFANLATGEEYEEYEDYDDYDDYDQG